MGESKLNKILSFKVSQQIQEIVYYYIKYILSLK